LDSRLVKMALKNSEVQGVKKYFLFDER